MENKILFYKSNEPYGFLNNFKKSRMFVFDRWWNNVEAPYQAKKCIHPSDFHSIWLCLTPREARNLGQKVVMRQDWDRVKEEVMRQCLVAKFTQNHDFLQQLLDTGHATLVEDSPVDSYWGRGPDGDGENRLGYLLMEVREYLRGF